MSAFSQLGGGEYPRWSNNTPPTRRMPLKDEAVIRFAGYLAQSDLRRDREGVHRADGYRVYVTNHAAAFRNSGAAMLLTRWRVRRAGAIG